MQRFAGRFVWVLSLAMSVAASEAHAQATDASDDAVAAAAATPEQDLAAIRELLLYARYAAAEPAIVAYLARTDLDAAQRNAGLESRAMVLIARRRAPDARAVLAELYGRDPEHTIRDPDAGPDVRNEFDRARAAHPAHVTVTLEDTTEYTMSERTAPTVEIHISAGADAVQELRLWYRNGTEGPFLETIMALDRTTQIARTRFPLADGRDEYVAQYYVDARAPSGAGLERIGNPENPLTVSVPAAAPIPVAVSADTVFAPGPVDAQRGSNVTDEWWFWTLIGVAVVGAGVGIGFGVNAATTPSTAMPGSLGQDRL